jgi:TPR repeat protein
MKRHLVCLIVLLFASLTGSAHAEKRVALVVGNSAYQNVGRLDNPANDASLMANTLKGLGFTLVGNGAQLDLDKTALDGAVQNFGQKIQGADVALFYYAGHGVQVRGSNYLVPVNANPTREADVDFQMVDINLVLNQMQGSGTRLNLVILDACRNNPFGGRGLRSSEGGLAQITAPEGTLISYATQPGSVAQDGGDGNSPYTKALATTIRRPGLELFQAFNQVGLAVKRSTGGSQQPWVSSSPIDGNFYFASPEESSGEAPHAPEQESRLTGPSDPLRLDLVTDCDRLAANPVDPQRPRGIAGVRLEKIDVVPALAACEAAMRQFPDVARFTYQAGRIAAAQKDYQLARQLYDKAATAGEPGSMNNLGILFFNGLGVAKDFVEAHEWYQKAAAKGVAVAMANIGSLYVQGNGVPKNYAEALKWYGKAADAGDASGMNGLGYVSEHGYGVPEDLTDARKWSEPAAAGGEPKAMTNLGNLYRDGRGVTRNYDEARRWFEKASAAGNANGMNNLGVLYFRGYGVPQDYSEARKWYEKAAAAGDMVAMRNLGAIYAQGNGVARDRGEARKWYEKAVAAGDEPAKTSLRKLELAARR